MKSKRKTTGALLAGLSLATGWIVAEPSKTEILFNPGKPTPLEEAIAQWEEIRTNESIIHILRNEELPVNELRANNPSGWLKTTSTIPGEKTTGGRIKAPGNPKTKTLGNWALTETGITPLHAAAYAGNTKMVKDLLDAGHPRNPTSGKWKWTPLRIAAEQGNIQMAHLLMGIKEGDPGKNNRILISIEDQTLTLEKKSPNGWETIVTTQISSGKTKYETPKGTYFVSDKSRIRRSNLYPADMPYFMRLSLGAIGIHQGHVPNYPASHGCVRVPAGNASKLFSKTPVGTEVTIF